MIKAYTKRRMDLEVELSAILAMIEKNHLKRKATATCELKTLCYSNIGDTRRGWIAYRLTILIKKGLIERVVFGHYKKVEL